MKIPVCSLLAFFSLCAFGMLHANPELAEHYLSKAPQYLGKTVQVQVAYLTPYAAGPDKNGVHWFNAITASGNKSGGLIAIRIPSQDTQSFLQKYGEKLQYTNTATGSMATLPLSGIFSKTKLGKYFIDCTGK